MKISTRNMLHSQLGATVAAALIASAAPAHADAPSNRADPCLLVTAADAQTALGVSMGQPKAMDDGLYRHCTYASADGRFYLYVSTIDDDEASFEKGRKLTTKHSKTISGLGANSYSDEDRNMLLIFKKGILLNIQAGDHTGKLSGEQLDAAEFKAAVTAVPRL
jgi:hypothetical protein